MGSDVRRMGTRLKTLMIELVIISAILCICTWIYSYDIIYPFHEQPVVLIGQQNDLTKRVFDGACANTLSDVEWNEFQYYKSHEKEFLHIENKYNETYYVNNLEYRVRFLEKKSTTCLEAILEDDNHQVLVRSGAKFRIEIDSNTGMNLCMVEDYHNGTYHIICPITESCNSVRIQLLYINSSAYHDVNGTQRFYQLLDKQLYCPLKSGAFRHSAKKVINFPSMPKCPVDPHAYVSWVHDWDDWNIAVGSCLVAPLEGDLKHECLQNNAFYFVGGPTVSLYYWTALVHLGLIDGKTPKLSKNMHVSNYNYAPVRTVKEMVEYLSSLSKDNSDDNKGRIIIFGDFELNVDDINVEMEHIDRLDELTAVIRNFNTNSTQTKLLWLPYITTQRTTASHHHCCHGNDFVFSLLNRVVSEQFEQLGVHTLSALFYASRIHNCGSVFRGLKRCTPEFGYHESNATASYLHRSLIDLMFQYICQVQSNLS